MKKFILALVITFMFFIVGSAQAWVIEEDSWYSSWPSPMTTVNIDVVNNSNDSILGFGVGVDYDLIGAEFDTWAPMYDYQLGTWESYIVSRNEWSTKTYQPGYNDAIDPTMIMSQHFGSTWDNIFGTTYDYAYIAVADGRETSVIRANISTDGMFSYVIYDDYGPRSPAFAMFAQGGLMVGGTGQNNQNPGTSSVPEPATMILLGTCLAGLGFIKRKK